MPDTPRDRLDPARWEQLWQRLGAAAPGNSFGLLQAAYDEPSRHYHGARHILACLAHLDTHRALAERPDVVELALWLHDLVYDSRRQDNEAASALQARAWLAEAGLARLADAVEAMILATCHQQPATSADEALVVDLDLAILASPQPIYQRYESDVRREYAWVPGPLFRAGRAKLLQQLLAMPHLYQRPELAAQWEAPARANLQRALAQLQD